MNHDHRPRPISELKKKETNAEKPNLRFHSEQDPMNRGFDDKPNKISELDSLIHHSGIHDSCAAWSARGFRMSALSAPCTVYAAVFMFGFVEMLSFCLCTGFVNKL